MLDRGLQFGDGLFTTIAIFNAQPCLWSYHRQRLRRGLQKLHFPPIDWNELEQQLWAQAEQVQQARLKLIITRGASNSGYRVPESIQPQFYWQIAPWSPQTIVDAKLTLCRHRLSINPDLAGIKHLNRLDQVLARMEWQDEYLDGLMLDSDGWVIEGTMSNLFILKSGQLYTPKLDRCGVAGVMRQYIMDHETVIETRLRLQDVEQADGLYISNALLGLVPIAYFLDRPYHSPLTYALPSCCAD